MFPCNNCPEKYIGQTSKKIQTRLTEHRNAINRHDHSSLPAKHADDNGHKFDWSQTRCLGQATTKHSLLRSRQPAEEATPNMPVSLRKRGIVCTNI